MPQQQWYGGVAAPPVKRAPNLAPTGDPTHSTYIPVTDQYTTPVHARSPVLDAGGAGAPSGGGGGPAGSINVKGYSPDFQALMMQDPVYLAWANAHPGVVADAGTQRKAAIHALAMQYGGLPSGFTDTYGDLAPADLAAAQANPYSDMNMLQQQYKQNVDQMQRGLAARGQLHSGDLGYGQGQLDQQLGANQYNLSNQFSGNLSAAIQNYLGTLSGDESNRRQALGQAYQDVSGNPAYTPTPDQAATLVPTWQSDYGEPVYQTSGGALYVLDANGNPVPYTGA